MKRFIALTAVAAALTLTGCAPAQTFDPSEGRAENLGQAYLVCDYFHSEAASADRTDCQTAAYSAFGNTQ